MSKPDKPGELRDVTVKIFPSLCVRKGICIIYCL